MNEVNKLETLQKSLLAADLEEADMAALADPMGVRTVPDGEMLVAEGGACRTLFVLAAGALDVCRGAGGTEEIIYQMKVGECVGARAFVDGSPYMMGLRAVGESSVLTLEPEAFEALGERHPRLMYRVMRALFRITHINMTRVYFEGAELRNYLLKTGGRY
ncbi:Crp/Fnr family transcriptional regulator [uncultured Thiodictyon sp.]|uniref:Crp/Fnr family transcriptional regulator n=1 Tax=uncultured Thiodictyon sp. TaxID=1846217 RepID=UPI0025F0358F|nr:cyclic nucleotide-binding domain-containing protein [uncultured Thiodictyon sp.]